ncbi:hypothetical protein [Flavobacterium sp.]|uniref:hypothetical protein n=1 Tax=Flavobacterium sp. TaxID=239 RepID=UPI0025FB8877|nr:hypothetical protein [Flavobacterium sp.]
MKSPITLVVQKIGLQGKSFLENFYGIGKNLLFMAIFLFSLLINAQLLENSKKIEPTLEVKKAFEKDFPKITPIWRKEFDGNGNNQLSYEANFNLNDTNMTAVYSANGLFNVLQVEIKTADIPVRVSNYMAKNYPKNNIKKAAKLMTNSNKTTYEIAITINGKWVNAIFNKEGDFLEMFEKE